MQILTNIYNSEVSDEAIDSLLVILLKALKESIVIFEYTTKKEGSLRSAVGTLNPNLIPIQSTKEWEDTIKHLALGIGSLKMLDDSGVDDTQNIPIGSLDESLVSLEQVIIGISKKIGKTKGVANKEYSIDKAVTYYDFTKKAPRAFLPKNLVKIVIP